MQLLLLRHANADTVAVVDDERPLSSKGREQAHKVASFCKRNDLAPALILTSPLRRADETARIVSRELGVELVTEDWLASGMEPAAALEGLKQYQSHETVMIVGHEPDFSTLAAWLTGLPDSSNIHIRKASLTALDLQSLQEGTARLEFSIPCRLM